MTKDAFMSTTTTKKVEKVVEEVEVATFDPDYKYASFEDIKAITVNQLAKLEVDLHALRMAFIANGENPHALVGPGRPIGEEMSKITNAILLLESYFNTVL